MKFEFDDRTGDEGIKSLGLLGFGTQRISETFGVSLNVILNLKIKQ